MILGFTIGNFIDEFYYLSFKYNLSSLISYGLIPILFSIGLYYSKDPLKIYNSIRYVIFILFIAIIIQNFFPSFFDPFISRAPHFNSITNSISIDLSRGRRSLFAEPSFISSFILLYSFNMIILKLFLLKNIKIINLLLFLSLAFTLTFLSLSGQILIVLLILFISSFLSFLGLFLYKALKFINQKKLFLSKRLLFLTFFLFSLISSTYFTLTNFITQDFRINYFIRYLQKDISVIFKDQSLIWRLHAIYMPIMAPFLEPFNIIPNKSAYITLNREFGYPLKICNEIYRAYSEWFTNLTGSTDITLPTRTYSIVGNINYDFTFIGLIFSIYFIYKICSSIDNIIKTNSSKEEIFSRFFFSILFILFSYINLSLLCPPYWFFSGFLYGLGQKKVEEFDK